LSTGGSSSQQALVDWILVSVAFLLFGVISVTREVWFGTGQWNLHKTVGWGLGYHQLRMVGRYWSRRNIDFRNPFIIQTRVGELV
jgi:hypothetical protein